MIQAAVNGNSVYLGEQLPPHNLAAERAVIGAILLDKTGEVFTDVAARLTSTDFHHSAHATIYRAIEECIADGTEPDPITLSDWLERWGQLDEIGGNDCLTDIIADTPHSAHGDFYADIVRRKSDRRNAIRFTSERLQRLRDDPDDRAIAADFPEFFCSQSAKARFQVMSAREFAEADFRLDYWIPGALVKGQPCIVGAANKTMKTSICAIDLSLSLAFQHPFLGKFHINEPATTMVLSGESGLRALQDTANRVCAAKGVSLRNTDRWYISADIPNMKEPADIMRLRALVHERSVDVLIVDPAYLCMGVGASESANMFEMGAALRPLAELAVETGCTPILIHHFRSTTARQFEPPDLSDLSHAGFAAFARQWLLLSRREPYQDDGNHNLWLRCGGSAGHSALWAVDVDEGLQSDDEGRRWDVAVRTAAEARHVVMSDKEARNAERQEEQLDRDRDAIIRAMEKFPDGETRTVLRQVSGVNKSVRFNGVIDLLLKDKIAVKCEIKKPNRNRPYEAVRLAQHPHCEPTGPSGPTFGTSGPVGGTTTYWTGGLFNKPPVGPGGGHAPVASSTDFGPRPDGSDEPF